MPSLPSVLIVDDEVRSQESLRRTLEEDFEVFTASDAAEARAILEGQTCEIVLTDPVSYTHLTLPTTILV